MGNKGAYIHLTAPVLRAVFGEEMELIFGAAEAFTVIGGRRALSNEEEKVIGRVILPLIQRATLVQTFGQRNHVCLKEGSITIPPFAPPQKIWAHIIPPDTPRSIFVYDVGNDVEEAIMHGN